ncbi:MAG: CDP-diacylglycerol--glycerol-3-phosphate 3-phosphatidyltransferase [Clostridia bacterium]|nr:CDP-diacylglycerol--glycerol-3-phosphate 3-phosphatidyltransferase [Clostridia bacterium]
MNLPNKISICRILLIPIVMFFYLATFIECGKLVALLIYVVAASTDFVDGMIARRTNQVTSLGKFLDESADKLLTTSILVMILSEGILNNIFCVLAVFSILARDQIVGFLRRMAVQRKGLVVAADKLGKIKTIILDISLALIMFLSVNNTYLWLQGTLGQVYLVFTYTVFSIGLVMNLVSGINYVYKYRECLKDEKTEN